MKLLAITDRSLMNLEQGHALMRTLRDRLIVQIREKDLDARTLYQWTADLLTTAEETGAELFINGRVDVASCFAGKVGVHLPENGLNVKEARSLLPPGTRVGRSIHAVPVEIDADLYTIAPVFPTPSKLHASSLGIDGLRDVVRSISSRAEIYALGGIDRTTAEAVLKTGVHGIAAIRAAWSGELVQLTAVT